MSKEAKQYKQFTIEKASDACLVLGSLISRVTISLDKYKEYANELGSMLEETNTEYVEAKIYDDINDKLLYRQRELLALIADEQNSSFSYLHLRKHLMKHKFLTTELGLETTQLLSELLDVRNWTFHNPQSLMVAAREAAEKNIPDELRGIVTVQPQLNPVIIENITAYELIMLATLDIHAEKRIEQFEHILACMKEDYQTLYDSLDSKPMVMMSSGLSREVQYIKHNIVSGLSDYRSDVSQISMAIQKSKYDGTKETFDKWVIRPPQETETTGQKSEQDEES